MHKSDRLAIKIIIEVIHELYGYDFSNYSKASFKRRLVYHKTKQGLETLADMIPYLLNNPRYFHELLSDLSVTVTEMFRDSHFYRHFSEKVMPKLKTYSFLKIWHAGCATGEEVYSMAILLEEHCFLERTQLYGTDFNPHALAVAKQGIYSKEKYDLFSKNYHDSGGKASLESYFIEKYDAVKIKHFLQKRIAFSEHNLATDSAFGDMEVIVCRNVMIYFEDTLKQRVLKLFRDSLVDFGFLCLGDKETITDSGFKCIDREACIYQKVPL